MQCVYILLLEVDANPSCPEHSHMVQAVHCITGEAGNGFRDDIVDFPRQAVVDHLLELGALICTCPGDALICVESGELPFGFSGNHLGIYLLLVGIGCELLLAVGGYPAVGSNPPLMILLPVDDQRAFWLNNRYCFLGYLGYIHFLHLRSRHRSWYVGSPFLRCQASGRRRCH